MDKNKGAQVISLTSSSVANYLRKHPDFFNQHIDLLACLSIPHDSGKAISLIEKQVAVLQEKNQKLSQRLGQLIQTAKHNEELAGKLQQLTLKLLVADDPPTIFNTLYKSLSNDFQAEHSVVRIFSDTSLWHSDADEFAGEDKANLQLFAKIIDAARFSCGIMSGAQCRYLFGERADVIQSSLLLPLFGDRWSGIIAIGSIDIERFRPDMGGELWLNLAQIFSRLLDRYIARDGAGED